MKGRDQTASYHKNASYKNNVFQLLHDKTNDIDNSTRYICRDTHVQLVLPFQELCPLVSCLLA